MAEPVVLDASAILAVLHNEPGADMVLGAMDDPNCPVFVSAVNLCEVSTRLVAAGGTAWQVSENIKPFLEYVVDFDLPQATHAAELSRITKVKGLSLGDRACLALAASRKATAWTTDRIWMKLKLDIEILTIR